MKLRYYAEAETDVDHRRTLDLLESITEEHAIPVEVFQVKPKRDPPVAFPGTVEQRSLEDAWDDFTYNRSLQEGLDGAPSSVYPAPGDIVGNVGIVVDGTLVWATRFWGTHHGWGPVDPEDTAIGFLEDVHARGPPAVADRVPLDDWSFETTAPDAGAGTNSAESAATPAVDELYEPTRNTIRDLCTAQSFQRGITYYEEERVRDLTIEGSEVTATVQGSTNYRTTVDLSEEDFDAWCSCPYDYAGECKHVVAVLLTVRERSEDVADQSAHTDHHSEGTIESTATDDTVERALEDADVETLQTFLRDLLNDDEDLRERFLATVDEPIEKSVADYKRDIDQQFADATDRRGLVGYDTHLSFDEYYEIADSYRENGRHERALDIYRALAEGLRENLSRVDDSNGYYGQQIERAIDTYAEALSEAELVEDKRRNHIEYLFEEYRTAEFAFVREYYDSALRTVCETTDELEALSSLLQSSLPIDATDTTDSDTGKSGWQDSLKQTDGRNIKREQLLSTSLWVLSELDECDQLQTVLEAVYTERSAFYRQYVELLVANGQDEQAQEMIEKGLDDFYHSKDIYRLAAEFYETHDQQRYQEVLTTLFVRFEDWDAYDDLKEACTDEEWASYSHAIVSQLGRLDADRLIDLYIYEDEYEKAFERVLTSDDIEKFRRYRADVAATDPRQYFEAYRTLLEPYLAGETGRDHYRAVIDHLREMAQLGFEDELTAFVDHLKEKHSNRPALLDELQNAGF